MASDAVRGRRPWQDRNPRSAKAAVKRTERSDPADANLALSCRECQGNQALDSGDAEILSATSL